MSTPLTTYELITDLLQYEDGVNHQLAKYRRRILRDAQRCADQVWTWRNWDFRYGAASVTASLSTGIIGDVPAGFLGLGPGGSLTVSGQRHPLVWMPRRDYSRAFNAGLEPAGIPRRYTELDVVAGIKQIAVYPVPSTSSYATMLMSYDKTSPMLADEESSNGGLDVIPAQWHRTVIYNGTLYYMMKKKGQSQSRTEQWDLYQKDLQRMCAEERGGRSETHNLPAYGMTRGRIR